MSVTALLFIGNVLSRLSSDKVDTDNNSIGKIFTLKLKS